MSSITFNPTTLAQNVKWSDPDVWSPAQVPDSPDDAVVIPVIYSYGNPFPYGIDILAGQFFTIGSLDLLSNTLSLEGALNVSGDCTIASTSGGIVIDEGTLTAGSLELSSQLTGNGSVTSRRGAYRQRRWGIVGDSLANVPTFTGGGYNLTVSAGSLTLEGSLATPKLSMYHPGLNACDLTVSAGSLTFDGNLDAADSDATLTVTPGGFSGLQNGLLTSGSYTAVSDIFMNVGSVPTADGADITLGDGGALDFYDPANQSYEAIQATLNSITSTGKLELSADDDVTSKFAPFGALTDSGQIVLRSTTFNAVSLTIAPGGELKGAGTLAAPTVNNGLIAAADIYDSDNLYNYNFDDTALFIPDTISGTGSSRSTRCSIRTPYPPYAIWNWPAPKPKTSCSATASGR